MPAEELATCGQLPSESGVLKHWGWVIPMRSKNIFGKGRRKEGEGKKKRRERRRTTDKFTQKNLSYGFKN